MSDNDFPITIAEFQKNARGEIVRIALESFKGSPLITIRLWFRDGAGALRPGKDGLNIAIRHLPALAAGIAAAEARARALGLIGDGGQ
jgi:hypothetical protein